MGAPAFGAVPRGPPGYHWSPRGRDVVRAGVSVGRAPAVTVTVLPSASGPPSVRHTHKSPPPSGPVTLGQRPGRLEFLILF